ncbi:MAG: Cof-type HAD-IIB family hydrolase [Christensenellales bacterium]|jgi:Cof subfamily protein (haloacid dehalogenase superfamily)
MHLKKDGPTDVKIIALDLDDTLLNEKRSITPKVRQAISDAAAAGIIVVLASGRMLPAAMPIHKSLELDTPLICCNGAYVCHPGGEVIFRCPIDKKTADKVLQYSRDKGIYIQYYVGNDYFYEGEGEESRLYESLTAIPGIFVDDLMAIQEGSDKLLMIGLPNMDKELEVVKEAFPELSIARSKPFYVEINHPGATKGAALKALADHYGFSREQVMAIGDGTNDLPMLEYAGVSVAMDNAPEQVKKACKYITASCNEDGVAKAIYELAL